MGGSAMAPGVIADAVAAARAWLRLEPGAEEDMLAGLAESAILLAEAYLGAAVVARGFEDVLPAEDGWRKLRAVPVSGIAGLTGVPAEGAPFVMAVDAYGIDIDADGVGWVRVTRPGAAGRVAVAYTAGMAAGWDAVPAPVAQGVVMLIAHLFDQRGGDAAPPAAVAALWRPHRRMRLAMEAHA